MATSDMATSMRSGSSSQVYAQPLLPGSAREVAWSVRQSFERARRLADCGLATMLDWYDVAQQRRALRGMSDEMLKDIGVSRADAMREAGRRFWDMEQTR
jgi:uncharacterized protein YjiS (DUF1127 family)